MKKAFFTIILPFVFCGSLFSQNGITNFNESSGFSVHKITYGGTLGASFTKDASAITIAPQIGYNLTNWFNAGFGIGYSYLSFKDNTYSEKDHYAGINIYGRARVMQYLLVQVQPGVDNVWWTTEDKFSGEKISGTDVVPSFVLGAGFLVQNVYAMLYYDVVQNERSPYGNTIGYSVGFFF
jgi:hypothetical protein